MLRGRGERCSAVATSVTAAAVATTVPAALASAAVAAAAVTAALASSSIAAATVTAAVATSAVAPAAVATTLSAATLSAAAVTATLASAVAAADPIPASVVLSLLSAGVDVRSYSRRVRQLESGYRRLPPQRDLDPGSGAMHGVWGTSVYSTRAGGNSAQWLWSRLRAGVGVGGVRP